MYALVLTVDHLCRLGSTKGKELRASKDKVFSDPETKVMSEYKDRSQPRPEPKPFFHPLPIFCRPWGRFLDSEYGGHLSVSNQTLHQWGCLDQSGKRLREQGATLTK